MEKIDFDLDTVLENVGNLISEKASAKALELIFDIEPSVSTQLQGDPLRLPGRRTPRDGPLPQLGRLHEDAGRSGLVAALPPGPASAHRRQTMSVRLELPPVRQLRLPRALSREKDA